MEQVPIQWGSGRLKLTYKLHLQRCQQKKKNQVFYAKTKDDEQYKHLDNHNILS